MHVWAALQNHLHGSVFQLSLLLFAFVNSVLLLLLSEWDSHSLQALRCLGLQAAGEDQLILGLFIYLSGINLFTCALFPCKHARCKLAPYTLQVHVLPLTHFNSTVCDWILCESLCGLMYLFYHLPRDHGCKLAASLTPPHFHLYFILMLFYIDICQCSMSLLNKHIKNNK